jgi:hypothetical protein
MFIMGGVMLAVRIGVVEFQMVRAGGLRVPRINRPSAVPAHAAPAGDAERQASGGGGGAAGHPSAPHGCRGCVRGQSLDFGTAPDGSIEI